MSVIARLKVDKVSGEGNYRSVTMSAVYDSDPASPNYSFSQATPSASLTMSITNPAAFEQFVEGKLYDVAFVVYDPALGAQDTAGAT